MAKSTFSEPHFRDETAAFAYVEARVWPEGPHCPHCGAFGDDVGRLNGKTTRIGLHKCYACKGHFTVRQGTIFESSHVPLHLWLQVIHLMCASKKGVSSHQVQRMLRCSRKTAWFLCHRIREAMASDAIMGGGGGVIEADETFLGGPPNVFVNKKGWTGGSGEKKSSPLSSAVAVPVPPASIAFARTKSLAAWTWLTATASSPPTKPTTTAGSARSSSAT